MADSEDQNFAQHTGQVRFPRKPADLTNFALCPALKGQLGLERHDARTLAGVYSRVDAKLLAMSAAIWHNWAIGAPQKRSLIAYDHEELII